MSWTWALSFIGGGFLLLTLGAEGLVRGSSALALRLGISPLIVGLTVVAFGTSSPELVVSLRAALSGSGDISVGNVVGSNIMNIALILAVSALIRPLKVSPGLLRLDVPILLVSSLVLDLFLWNGRISRWEGAVLFGAICAYTFVRVFRAKRKATPVVVEVLKDQRPAFPGTLPAMVLLAGLGLASLLAGAKFMVEGAVVLAKMAGMSQAIIGLTVVALGTSLPELATGVAASLKGESGLALGNVVGSCIFNILAILGTAAVVTPLSPSGVTGVDLAVMTLAAFALVPIFRSGMRVSRPEGALLLLGYAAYLTWLFH